MKKDLSIIAYNRYMKTVNGIIKETESRIETLDKSKKISNLCFEDWVKWMSGELKLSKI